MPFVDETLRHVSRILHDYYQRLTLESWFTNLAQTLLNGSQQLPAQYKRLIDEIKQCKQTTGERRTGKLTVLTNNRRLFNRRIETHQLHYESL